MGKYVLTRRNDFDPYIGQNEYAVVVDVDKKEIKLLAIFVPDLFKKKNYHILSGSARLKETKQRFCLVKMDEVYLEFFSRMPEVIEPVLMHELGHFINGDWDSKKNSKTSEQIYKERIMLNLMGLVPKNELAADRFAAEVAGVDKTIKALRLLKKEREKKTEEGTELAIKEFENRIKALERMRNERLIVLQKD